MFSRRRKILTIPNTDDENGCDRDPDDDEGWKADDEDDDLCIAEPYPSDLEPCEAPEAEPEEVNALSFIEPEAHSDPSNMMRGKPKKSVFRNRLEGVLYGITKTIKDTSLDAMPQSAFARGFFFYIINCDRSHGWEAILDITEQGTPAKVREMLAKPSITHEDFLQLPLVTETHTQPGIYLNHVVDMDGDNAIYINSTIRGLRQRIQVHQQLIQFLSPRYSSLHYKWTQEKPSRVASFRVLIEFDRSTPGWVILLIESIFIIMLKSYSHTPGLTSTFDMF